MLSFVHGPYKKELIHSHNESQRFIFFNNVSSMINEIRKGRNTKIYCNEFPNSVEAFEKVKYVAKRKAKSFSFVHNGDFLKEPPLLNDYDIKMMKEKPIINLIREIDPFDKVKRNIGNRSTFSTIIGEEKSENSRSESRKNSLCSIDNMNNNINYRRVSNTISLDKLIANFNMSLENSFDESSLTSYETLSHETDESFELYELSAKSKGKFNDKFNDLFYYYEDIEENDDKNESGIQLQKPLSLCVCQNYLNSNKLFYKNENLDKNSRHSRKKQFLKQSKTRRRHSIPSIQNFKPYIANDFISKDNFDQNNPINIIIPSSSSKDPSKRRLSRVSLLRRSIPCIPISPTDFKDDNDPCVAVDINKDCACASICACPTNFKLNSKLPEHVI